MFVVMTVACTATFVYVYHAHWIDARHDFLLHHFPKRDFEAVYYEETSDTPRAPWVLGLFGERGHSCITVVGPTANRAVPTDAQRAAIDRARSLFPEALVDWRERR